MTLSLEKQGRAWVRLPRPLHLALTELRDADPRPVRSDLSQFARFEPNLERFLLARSAPALSQISDAPADAQLYALNDFGRAWAKALPPISHDKRVNTPLFPLADVLDMLPDNILSWLSGAPPIAKHQGGLIFETLGVLAPTIRGDGYYPERVLMLALEELRQRRQAGRSFTPELQVQIDVDPEIAQFLVQTTNLPGVAWQTAKFDGRALRRFNCAPDGAGFVDLVTDADGTKYYRAPHMVRALVAAIGSGERDAFRLALLMPKVFREWIALGAPLSAAPPQHTRMAALIGLVKRKGKYDWKLTPMGERVMPLLAAHQRAEEGVQTVDLSLDDGDGVDITLPDDPAEMTMDLSLDTEFAEHSTAGIVEADTRGIVEAPTPPFTKDGGGYRLTVEDHRQDYLDSVAPDISATDDEFNIL